MFEIGKKFLLLWKTAGRDPRGIPRFHLPTWTDPGSPSRRRGTPRRSRIDPLPQALPEALEGLLVPMRLQKVLLHTGAKIRADPGDLLAAGGLRDVVCDGVGRFVDTFPGEQGMHAANRPPQTVF
jgi:hypothetical protein